MGKRTDLGGDDIIVRILQVVTWNFFFSSSFLPVRDQRRWRLTAHWQRIIYIQHILFSRRLWQVFLSNSLSLSHILCQTIFSRLSYSVFFSKGDAGSCWKWKHWSCEGNEDVRHWNGSFPSQFVINTFCQNNMHLLLFDKIPNVLHCQLIILLDHYYKVFRFDFL